MVPRSGRSRERGWVPGVVVGLGGVIVGLSSVLSWLRVPTDVGGMSTVTGFGQATLTSPDPAAPDGFVSTAYDFNQELAGTDTFHPGWITLVAGGLLVVTGIVLGGSFRSRGRVHRTSGGLAIAVGLAVGVFAVLRILQPDSLDVLAPGEARTGAGQWLALAGAVVVVGAAVAALLALRPEQVPARRRSGIQP